MDYKANPSTDLYSNHNLVVMKNRFSLKKWKKSRKNTQWNIYKLTDSKVKQNFETNVDRGLKKKESKCWGGAEHT